MEETSYQNRVLSYIKDHNLKFAFDRNILIRGIGVGVIPTDGSFTTPEIITGGYTGSPMCIPFNDIDGITEIYPEINWHKEEVMFPLMNSDGSKIINREGVTVNLADYSRIEGNFSSTSYEGNDQDDSLLNLPSNFIRVTSDRNLSRKLEQSGQWVIGHIAYFVILLDLSGTEYLSMQYLDMKVKYVNFCQRGNFWIPKFMKMGRYFDKIYLSRETEIYKPLYERFVKNDSTNLCP